MAKIIGNTTATPNPCPDWNQADETKADYVKNKPAISSGDGKDYQVVVGHNNIVDKNANFIIGSNGNLFTVGADDTGNYLTLGNDKLYEGTIATKEYVDELVSGIDTMLDEVIDSQNSYIGGETE